MRVNDTNGIRDLTPHMLNLIDEIRHLEHVDNDIIKKRKGGRKRQEHEEEDKESESSTETGSKSPISERDLVTAEFEMKNNQKRKRKNGDLNNTNDLFLTTKQDIQAFRRTTLNSQNTLYTYEQLEVEFPKKQTKRLKRNRAPSESVSRSDGAQHVIEHELSDKASESQSSKNSNNGPIEHEINLIEIECNSSKFAQQGRVIKKKMEELQSQLVRYIANQSSAMGISNLIQECLNEFSVEYLSSSELMEYLQEDIGKLLYTLLSVLEEFEKIALESKVTIHSTIKSKIEKVRNLFNTVKIRAVADFLEQHEFAQKYSNELQQIIQQKEADRIKKEQELQALNQKLEQMKAQKETEQPPTKEKSDLHEKNKMETEPPIRTEKKTEPINPINKANTSNNNSQEKTATEAEELKDSSPELGNRCFSAPNTLNMKEQKPVEALSPVPDQSVSRNLRAQSVPELPAEPISNPNMRKVVVLQLVKYLQKKYDLNQDVAREKTILIERNIRLSSPEMKEEYKKRYNLVVELMKQNLVTLDEITDSETTDWAFLESKLENISRQKKKGNETESKKNFSPKPNKERSGKSE